MGTEQTTSAETVKSDPSEINKENKKGNIFKSFKKPFKKLRSALKKRRKHDDSSSELLHVDEEPPILKEEEKDIVDEIEVKVEDVRDVEESTKNDDNSKEENNTSEDRQEHDDELPLSQSKEDSIKRRVSEAIEKVIADIRSDELTDDDVSSLLASSTEEGNVVTTKKDHEDLEAKYEEKETHFPSKFNNETNEKSNTPDEENYNDNTE